MGHVTHNPSGDSTIKPCSGIIWQANKYSAYLIFQSQLNQTSGTSNLGGI